MYTKQPKKLLVMNILDILRRYSDADHRLNQKEIIDILQREYDMSADRKAVRRNLMNLIDFGCRLEYTESVRRGRDGEEEAVLTDWYLERDFSDAELRLLIDSLLFSGHIPYSQRKELIEKLKGLSSCHFSPKVRHVQSLPDDRPQNPELFYTVEMLDEAIEKNRQVLFYYGDYGTDHKLHLRRQSDGQPRRYLVNPYQMAAANGRYYLICNVDKYDNVAHYRLDHIRDIEILDAAAKSSDRVKGLENGFDLSGHMAEHIYMFSGESGRVTMKTTPGMVGNLIDWFGSGVTFTDETEESVTAYVTVDLQAMRFWALQYAPYVTVLSPQSLVDEIRGELRKSIKRYEVEHGGNSEAE